MKASSCTLCARDAEKHVTYFAGASEHEQNSVACEGRAVSRHEYYARVGTGNRGSEEPRRQPVAAAAVGALV